MSRIKPFARPGIAVAALAAAAVSLASCAAAPIPHAPPCWETGPEILRVSASGVQTYRFDAGPDGRPQWKFVGPAAELLDTGGRKIGTHYKGATGPVWEIGPDKVIGKKLCERPSPHEGAIPELQLIAQPAGESGVFKGVLLIERLDTTGGAAPPVDAAHQVGDEVKVPYSAEYVFIAGR